MTPPAPPTSPLTRPTRPLRFSLEEYTERLRKTRAAMEKKGVDLLIISDPSNMAWLTGYDGWSFYVHQAVVVAMDGEPLWFGREMDEYGARHTCYMGDAEITAYPDHYVQSTECHPMERLCAIITARGWGKGRIGVEMDNYWFSAAAFTTLTAGLSGARFRDATGLVNWCRAVKSPQELTYIREAAGIVSRMHRVIQDMIEPGVRKCDLVAAITSEGLRFTDGVGGDYPAIVPMLPSGAEAAAAHLTWDDQPFRAGEGTFFEIAGCRNRYHCPLSRTVFLGKPPEHFIHAERAVLEGMEAGLEHARPGKTCHDIADAFFSTLEAHGVKKDTRSGYSVGLSYPPDWGERTMSIRRGDHSVIGENMVFHFMTGLWMEEWGLELTETILITPDGHECLADVPRRLFVKE